MSLPARWFGLRTVSDRHGAPSQGRSPTQEGYCPEPARGSRGRSTRTLCAGSAPARREASRFPWLRNVKSGGLGGSVAMDSEQLEKTRWPLRAYP